MYFDGLIFDLDGTLWDCSAASTQAFNLAYEKLHVDKRVTEEFVRSISGRPASECDEILLLTGVPAEIKEKLLRYLDQYELAAVQRNASNALYPGVKEGLLILATKYPLFLVSNCGEKYLETFRQIPGVSTLFTDSECFGKTQKVKADNIRAVVMRNNLSSACYIGDTSGDESAAYQAGIPFFHAKYGFGTPIREQISFGTFNELTSYFLNMVT